MQTKDIPDLPILSHLMAHGGIGCHIWEIRPTDHRLGIRAVIPEDVPQKVLLAKMKNLIKRGLVSGCACGCRGDFEITDKGKAQVSSYIPSTPEESK